MRMLRADFRRTRTTSVVLAGLIAMAALLAAISAIRNISFFIVVSFFRPRLQSVAEALNEP